MSAPAHAHAEYVHALKQVIQTNHEIARMVKASLKQWYSGPELRDRWNLSEAELTALLREEIKYVGGSGKRISVEVSDVLHLDDAVKRRRQPVRAVTP